MHQDELDIANAFLQGDDSAFENLFKNYYQRLCTHANSFLQDVDEAEETVQNVFVKLWEKRGSMQITSSLQAYLYSSVRNACLNKLKHNKVKQLYTQEQEALASVVLPATHITFQNELQKQIHDAIESLPEQCRIIFKMSRFDELKYAEIAEQLNLSIKTVENQMGKALRMMRERLKDYLVVLAVLISIYK